MDSWHYSHKNIFNKIRASPRNGTAFSASKEVFIQTFHVPNNLTLVNSSLSSISLKWVAPTSGEIMRHKLLYEEVYGLKIE